MEESHIPSHQEVDLSIFFCTSLIYSGSKDATFFNEDSDCRSALINEVLRTSFFFFVQMTLRLLTNKTPG